jgi:hypothetical protein
MLRPLLPTQARRVLDLASRDRAAAARALGELPLEAQVALVCETPLARRAELLALAPAPEALVPKLPEAELCFTLKAVGLADGAWMLAHATPEQMVACVDLDAWRAGRPDPAALGAWIEALAEAGDEALLRGAHALDAELLTLLLRSRLEVAMRPAGDDGWQPPEGARTLEGQFHLVARDPRDDLADVLRLLQLLLTRDYWTYFRLLQAASWELESDLEEWALRWRGGRLQDLGFPPWEEAMEIYRHLRPSEWAAVPEQARALELEPWRLPIWLPSLPLADPSPHSLFRAIAALGEEERRAAFHALVALANKVAVADGLELSDAESTPRAIEKAARFASLGLDLVAGERGLAPAEVVRRVPLQRLFRIGANRDPERARPRLREPARGATLGS